MPDQHAAIERGYAIREAKALHEVGVTNHGWYMTEAEHRGVLNVICRMESALLKIRMLTVEVGDSVEAATRACDIAMEALDADA